ncbi:MAG: hypothetical protein HRU41_02765 [Saprospiraceae bacterium]|nr:hypothetical protein [Saprospiraceae bacterium]
MRIKKLLLKLAGTVLFLLVLLISFLLNPSLLYANKTVYQNIIIHHQGPLRADLFELIDQSLGTAQHAEIADPVWKSHLCLNDGSPYPGLVRRLLGEDVFTAFSNKVVFLGQDLKTYDRFYLWDRELKYSQFLTHGLVHNLQFNHHGFWDANPLGGYPMWRWEGYAEYVTLGGKYDLKCLVEEYEERKLEPYAWFSLSDGEGTISLHVRHLILTKYAFEIKRQGYDQFLNDPQSESDAYEEVLTWAAQ